MMSFDYPSLYDEEPELTNPDMQGSDTDDDEGKAIPPLYICTHKDDPKCNKKHPHPPNPTVYYNVTRTTPCRYCGHTGTLRRVN